MVYAIEGLFCWLILSTKLFSDMFRLVLSKLFWMARNQLGSSPDGIAIRSIFHHLFTAAWYNSIWVFLVFFWHDSESFPIYSRGYSWMMARSNFHPGVRLNTIHVAGHWWSSMIAVRSGHPIYSIIKCSSAQKSSCFKDKCHAATAMTDDPFKNGWCPYQRFTYEDQILTWFKHI